MSPAYANASGSIGPGNANDPRNQLFAGTQVIQLNRKHPETLELDSTGKLSTRTIHKWMENMQSILTTDPQLKVIQYIHLGARTYLGLRFRQLAKDDPSKNEQWETQWGTDQLFKNLHVVWPKGMDNVTEYTLESKLKKTRPKIHFASALEDVTAWATTITRAVSDDVNIRNESLSLERQLQLVKILLEHLHSDTSVLGFIKFEIEKGGRPTSIQQFLDKLMAAGFMLQQAQFSLDS